MKTLIVFIVVVVIIINGYTFLKYKKQKRKRTNTVDSFRNVYLKSRMAESKPPQTSEKYTRYTTKYNSTVDYVDKDEFFREAASAATPSPLHSSKYTSRQKHKGLHNKFM